MTVRVKLVNLTKKFGNVTALDNLNLEVGKGEFVALLGPSGCGKSTTLYLIAGIYKPTSGYIYFDDKIVNDLEPKDRNVGMVFQNYALYPHMTVYDNIAFSLKIKKYPKQEIDRRVREVAKMLHIENLLDRKPAQLSGGQQQRVALARAIVKEPNIFLMDEPLSNLDAKLRIEMRTELKRLQSELKVTTIYVTHDQMEAMTMADRIAVMNEGKLQQYGKPEELYNRPANIFVADFIGSPPINLIPVELRKTAERIILKTPFGDIVVRDEGLRKALETIEEKEYIMGIRPEHLSLTRKATTDEGKTGLAGKVLAIEPLGKELQLDIGNDEHLIRVLAPVNVGVRVGERIVLGVDENRILIFDKRTGKLLV